MTTGVPLTVISPFLGFLLDLDGEAIALLALGLFVGTPALSLLGAIAAKS